jgi:hypothetical protein
MANDHCTTTRVRPRPTPAAVTWVSWGGPWAHHPGRRWKLGPGSTIIVPGPSPNSRSILLNPEEGRAHDERKHRCIAAASVPGTWVVVARCRSRCGSAATASLLSTLCTQLLALMADGLSEIHCRPSPTYEGTCPGSVWSIIMEGALGAPAPPAGFHRSTRAQARGQRCSTLKRTRPGV